MPNIRHLPNAQLEEIRLAARADLEGVHPTFFALANPREAINYGYVTYLEYVGAKVPGNHSLWQSINNRLDTFRGNSRTSLYVDQLQRVANVYARGLKRSADAMAHATELAREWKESVRRNEILTATQNGLIRGGVKLAVIAVTVFAAVLTLLGLDPASVERFTRNSGSHGWAAVFAAGVATLVSIWTEMERMRRLERDLLLRYQLKLQQAKIEHGQDRLRALLAAYTDMAEQHERILGERAPDDGTALAELVALTHPDIEEAKRDIAEIEHALKDSPWKRAWGLLRRRRRPKKN